jgi:hypothetical protein
MKVWIGYQCYFNYCDEFRHAVKVFDDEVKALIWKEEFEDTECEYRNYQEMDVE